MAKSLHVFMLILVLHAFKYALAINFSSLSLAAECSLLFQFKKNMSIGNYSKVASWNRNGERNCCLWHGVECRFGHVIGLDLSRSFLNGPISSNNSLFKLVHLRSLDLADNDFHSYQIPSGIGRLPQLANLNLSWSFFSGEVPKEISQLMNLVSLDVRGNDGLKVASSDFQNLFQNSSETLRELFLSGINFDSDIPASIGNLTHLDILDLRNCTFTGTLPASVSHLTQLTVLDLSNTYISGPFTPFANMSNLYYLNLKLNGMLGEIPSSLTNLTHLTVLDVSDNKFTGSLPSLERFSNLMYLSLSGNKFDRWKLPDWLGKLKKITFLNLANVNLYGEIPSSFYNLTQVEELYLSINQLKGQLSSSLLNFQKLELFYLFDNKLTVDFNLFLFLKELKYLSLNGNNITLSAIDSHKNETQPMFKVLALESCNLKDFPEFLRFQHQLEYLNLDNNTIEGVIPRWMWNTTKETLTALRLSHNLLTGEIPPFICDMLYIQLLDLSFNNFTGSIPPCLEKLSNSLEVLKLRSNNLQGTIPNIFTNKSKLQMIDLSDNKLEGHVPRSMENCKSLQILDLGYNFIGGAFPFWLGALSKLHVLILRFNKLNGVIQLPSTIKLNFPKLRIIDLSNNLFSGNLPYQYFQEWSSMKESEGISTYMETYMWGEYWFTIQMTNKGVNMEYKKIINTFFAVDFSSNMFEGNIPESIKALSRLKLLNLSNNDLSGIIPPSMGNLVHLESLDLSSNNLSGMIPQDLVQLNFLAVLNVSNNKLTGPIPQGTQFNTFLNDSYMGNQALCGYPLSIECGNSRKSMPPNISFEEESNSGFPNGIDWVVILIGVGSGLVIGVIYSDYITTCYYTWFLLSFCK